jgi:hypothetical protein
LRIIFWVAEIYLYEALNSGVLTKDIDLGNEGCVLDPEEVAFPIYGFGFEGIPKSGLNFRQQGQSILVEPCGQID